MPKSSVIEKLLHHLQHLPQVIGVDEAGRGCLAGPVIASAVILPESFDLTGINDSKLLSRSLRIDLAKRIKEHSIWAISQQSVFEIETKNILQASLQAMSLSVNNLSQKCAQVYIDGNIVPAQLAKEYQAKAIVKGDQKYACIAAASILAKVERDLIMIEAAKKYPEYGFDQHYGYGTKSHLKALCKYGPCEIHRKNFSPIKEMLNQPCLIFEK